MDGSREKTKTRKAFGKLDVLLFIALATLIFLLFLFFVILPKNDKGNGFEVFVDDQVVFTFYYSDGTYSIAQGSEEKVTVTADGENFKIKILVGDGFNAIQANVAKKTVKVTDADCSLRKDCVHSPSISGSGVIVCAPHKLRISPLGDGFIPPVGG